MLESDYADTINQFIKVIGILIVIIGLICIIWFFGDWVMISIGSKEDYGIFGFPSIIRLLLGMLFIIVFVFTAMIRKKSISELIPKAR